MIEKKTPQKEIQRIGKSCNRCGRCCMHGSGFVTSEDLKRISDHLRMTDSEVQDRFLDKVTLFNKVLWKPKQKKKPFGPCVFLENKECTIHSVKPTLCAISTCAEGGEEIVEWYLLNHVINPCDQEAMREWHLRLKTQKTIKGGKLEDLVPDKRLRDRILGERK